MKGGDNMVNINNWELDEVELILAERAFDKKSAIYVGHDGLLYEKDKGRCMKVDSANFDSLRIFMDEIRSTKIILDMKKILG